VNEKPALGGDPPDQVFAGQFRPWREVVGLDERPSHRPGPVLKVGETAAVVQQDGVVLVRPTSIRVRRIALRRKPRAISIKTLGC
jgi:hypothetical protein